MRLPPWVRRWARLMARLFPPNWSTAQRADLADLLVDAARTGGVEGRDRGKAPIHLIGYVARNTLICAWDAAFEWVSAGARIPTRGYGMGALRGLLRRPGYAVPALLTLALGIGINTAVFSVLYGVVLRPLPYPEPAELVQVFGADPERDERFASVSLPDASDWQERSETLAALAAYTILPSDLIYVADGTASGVQTAWVSHSFFDVMRPAPRAGRFFTRSERDDDPMVVVVSERFFRQRLGSNPAAIGGTIELTGRRYRVLGVAPASMAFPSPGIDVWTPLSTIPASEIPLHLREVRILNAVGRLSEQHTADEARAELTSIAMGLSEEYPDTNERLRGATVRPLQDGIVGSARSALVLLMGAAVLVLAIVCVNVANLAVARESRRETELAVRAALGASAARRTALVLSEGLVLALTGGVIGLVGAVFATRWLTSSAATVIPRAAEIGVQWPVAWFSLVAALGTGVAFSILPGRRAARADLAGRIRSGSNRIGGDGRARRLLIGIQTALSLGLLIGAVMMITSLANLAEVDVGFETEGLVVAEITFPSSRYPENADYLARYWATLEAFRGIPGVRSASAVRRFPFRGTGEGVPWSVPGIKLPPEETSAQLLQIAPDYFRTMGIPFIEGFDVPRSLDAEGLIPVVVTRSVAERAYPGEPAAGRLLNIGGIELLIRGVVDDVLQSGLVEEATPLIYVPQEAIPRRGAWFVLSTDGAPGVLQRVRDAVRTADPGQPISELATAQSLLSEQLARPALFTSLLSFFALSALVLSALGVYGVVAFGVERRRREIGVRMALGADRGRVRAMVVRDGMTPIMAGAVFGLGASALGARVMESLVFGMGVRSPAVYALAASTIVGTGVLACYLPARRASNIEPTRALEGE